MTTAQFATYGLLIVFSLVIVLHFCILFKIIPYTIAWGGRLTTDAQMYRFESISILLNLIFLFIAMVKAGIVNIALPEMLMTVLFWVMTILFAFNTFGNLLSKNKFEKWIFTPVTILLTAFSLILALKV